MNDVKTKSHKSQRPATLLGVLALLCFVVQQLHVPMHLSLHEHTYGEPHRDAFIGPGHAHGHGAHEHIGEASATGDEEGHRPHPAEDHLDESETPAVPSTVATVFTATPAPMTAWVHPRPRPIGRAFVAVQCPRPPPERRSRTSRAPPSCV